MAKIPLSDGSHLQVDPGTIDHIASLFAQAKTPGDPRSMAAAVMRASADPDYLQQASRAVRAQKWPPLVLALVQEVRRGQAPAATPEPTPSPVPEERPYGAADMRAVMGKASFGNGFLDAMGGLG